MATPVGPVAPDPDDPDHWDEWYEQDDDDDLGPYRRATPVRLIALVVAIGMALLVVLAR